MIDRLEDVYYQTSAELTTHEKENVEEIHISNKNNAFQMKAPYES